MISHSALLIPTLFFPPINSHSLFSPHDLPPPNCPCAYACLSVSPSLPDFVSLCPLSFCLSVSSSPSLSFYVYTRAHVYQHLFVLCHAFQKKKKQSRERGICVCVCVGGGVLLFYLWDLIGDVEETFLQVNKCDM